ncbi:hypothetical protein DV711_10320 [Motiliproteus coralliicola]|uniref:Uncharacterized protein n=1 Tax=Motiliproteus coralliicola TaxID=2283196 RepID=A0A369WPE8_9GAMM|nr:hypothetical protein [Motiliproteus coralliicola]RDE22939.1 hypothetical protein DV711_10320 [Motiliproteus coralliicola]
MKSAATILLLIAVLLSKQAAAAEQEQLEPQEQLEQKPLSIRGSRALPSTVYIAPWKQLGAPLDGATFENRLDDKPEPLEPEQFRKELELIQKGYSVDTVPDH